MEKFVKDVRIYNNPITGNLLNLEIIYDDFVEEFNWMELERYNIKSSSQFSDIDKMLKDYCFTTLERDRIIYLLATYNNNQSKNYLKAGEVMKLLDITRQTLCHYVKANKIVVVKMPGGQYRYDCTNLLK